MFFSSGKTKQLSVQKVRFLERQNSVIERSSGLALSRRFPPGCGVLAMVAFLGIIALYGCYLTHRIESALNWGAMQAGFSVRVVRVHGQERLADRDVRTALISKEKPQSLLFYDTGRAEKNLLAHPWVQQVSIRKVYPGRLDVSITEYKPFALWQKGHELFLIAKGGHVISRLWEEEIAAYLPKLPIIIGEGAEKNSPFLFEQLGRMPARFLERVRGSVFVGKRRWNLIMDQGTVVYLPEGYIEDALHLFWRLEEKTAVLSTDILSADLRLPDRIVLRMSDAAAQQWRDFVSVRLFRQRKEAQT